MAINLVRICGMRCNNPILNLVEINAYTKFGEHLSICRKILSGNEILAKIKSHNYGTNERKMKCNDPNLDNVNINAYKTFGENLSFYSQDIERKRLYDRRTDRRTNIMTDNPNAI